MIPEINKTSFGSITVDGEIYDHDINIALDGEVRKRKKKLSKAVYDTSHTISFDEIRYTFQDNSEGIIIGGGQFPRKDVIHGRYGEKSTISIKLYLYPNYLKKCSI